MKILSTFCTKTSKKTYIILSIITIAFGSLLHFAYEFFGEGLFIAMISPVNESVWEHLKLVLVPLILLGIVINIINFGNIKESNCLAYIIFKSIITGSVIIVAGHYAYKSIFSKGLMVFDISLYIATMIICLIYIYKKICVSNCDAKSDINENKGVIGLIGLSMLFILFIIFTVLPPKLDLFIDPPTKTYGVYMIMY